jgi:uncharacterized protein YuzE
MPDRSSTNVLRVTYDPEADAAYLYLTGSVAPGAVSRTVEATEDINLDFDKDGRLVGVELLSGKLLSPALMAIAGKPGQ